jgi:hypothetical protein
MAQNSTYALAREVAIRLERAGVNPYADDFPQYLILGDHREGEILEFGKPLRAHRMFPIKTHAKTERLAKDFEEFAATVDGSKWCFWTVHRASRKTKVHELVADLKQFNADLNNVFVQLRKHCGFELLIIGIHISFDETTGMFDIHAHFVCEIATTEQREDARRRLMAAFSRADTPDEPLRSTQGAARYLSRTFKLRDVVRWPIEALKAAWSLIEHKFHYTRTGGRFAGWRHANKVEADPHELEETRRRRKNRKETRYQPEGPIEGDTKLVSRMWNIQGKLIRGTLYRSAAEPKEPPEVPVSAGPAAANDNYSSALVDTFKTRNQRTNILNGVVGLLRSNRQIPSTKGWFAKKLHGISHLVTRACRFILKTLTWTTRKNE